MQFVKGRLISINNNTVTVFNRGVKKLTLNSLASYNRGKLKAGKSYIFGVLNNVIFNFINIK